MISPDTPPGTEVVCCDASPGEFGDLGLTFGAIYTIETIEFGLSGVYVAKVFEVQPIEDYVVPFGLVQVGLGLGRLRYLDIPPELTMLLEDVPVEELA